jgi:hypothetical protein
MPEAGWYDDPQGGGGKRWWDGERWSEHTTPPPGSMPPAAATPPPPPGAPTTATGWDAQAGTSTAGWQASTTPATTGTSAPARKGGAGKVVALILALVIVVGIGVVVAMLVSGSDDPEVVAADVVAGGERTISVPFDGHWDMETDLPAGLVVIDVRGLDGFDPVLELYDSTGMQVARNDDRSSDQEARYGGGFYDSLIEVDVPAGRYRIEVHGFAGQSGEATIAFPIIGG